jgi:hypothetical protein
VKGYIIGLVILLGSLYMLLSFSSSAPGESFVGRGVPPTTDEQAAAERLAGYCEGLAQDIGPRGPHKAGSQEEAARFLQRELRHLRLDPVEVALDCGGTEGKVYEMVFPGRALARETIVLAARLDSPAGSPGADDNATGVAVLLEVLRVVSGGGCDRTVRAAFWTGGAAPSVDVEKSAASAYVRRLKGRHERVAAVLCFDALGIYSDAAGSQTFPFPFDYFFPDKGDFVAFVGDWGSHGVVDKTIEQFRLYAKVPSQALSLPSAFDFVSLSDDGVLRDGDYPALRITDTGAWRNPVVGTAGDVVAHLDYLRMARIARGLADMVVGLAKKSTPLM